jgi:uncharacterized protein (DUF983 family)
MKETLVGAILKLKCPRCREGKVYAGLFRMNPVCPVCGLKFEREPGYFLGAMYLNYGMGGVVLIGWILGLVLFTSLPFFWDVASAAALLVLLTPLIFRYSRVIFMNIDRNAFPD